MWRLLPLPVETPSRGARRLTAREAELYREWIGNDRRIRALLDQMRTVAAKAAELLIEGGLSR